MALSVFCREVYMTGTLYGKIQRSHLVILVFVFVNLIDLKMKIMFG